VLGAEHGGDRRVHDERGPRVHDLVTRPQHDLAEEPQKLVASVADHDLLGSHAELACELLLQRASGPLGVAVQIKELALHRRDRGGKRPGRMLVAGELQDVVAAGARADLVFAQTGGVGHKPGQLLANHAVPVHVTSS